MLEGGNWGFGCTSSRHRIAVDNPTDGRESAEGVATNLPGRIPYHRRPSVPCAGLIDFCVGHRDCSKPAPSLHGPADPGFTIPPSRDLFRSRVRSLAHGRPMELSLTHFPGHPCAILSPPPPRASDSARRPSTATPRGVPKQVLESTYTVSYPPSLLAPPAVVVAFLRASLLYWY